VASETGDDFAGTERFEVVRRLGAGGMGVVYEAIDRDRNANVALKTLRTLKPDALLRFKNEFRALQDIEHPNLVTLGELFEDRERWFFTMEMVEGAHFLDYVRCVDEADELSAGPDSASRSADEPSTVDLPSNEERAHRPAPRSEKSRLSSGADETRLRSAFAQLALGLAALHRAQKVHRDIKPSNILVTSEGRVVILDFGLIADLLNMVPESHLVGTFSYMAPEQAGLKPIGPAADWYSVGVLLYQSLTGRLPVTGNAREVLVLKQAFEPAPPHVIAEVPEDLDALAMDLLRIDPAARPSGAEILRRLKAEDTLLFGAARGHASHFVGRRMELDALRKAAAMTRKDRGVAFFVHGESGVGKSSLIRRFTDGLTAEDPETVVLSGRCYERESVPYKAVDGIIDALSRYLTTLHETDLGAILPRQRGLIGQVFPVMRRIEAVAQAPRPEPGALDPQVLRMRLFFAVRDLFTRLAERFPVVLVIDDLQWADADSLALLADMMRPPGAPRLLLLTTSRTALGTETRAAEVRGEAVPIRSVEENAALFSGDVRRLHIESLPPGDARALVDALLRDAGAGAAGVSADTVAEDAGGHPLFIDELVRHKLTLGDKAGPLKLQDALRARIERLDPGVQHLLELVVVAGAPLAQETAATAAKIDFSEASRRVGVLRAAALVRTNGVRRTDVVEPYHDRVREAVQLGLSPEAERSAHQRLAMALEASHKADPEALAEHWRGAGDNDKAASYAMWAAGQAEEAIAFDRAARLYRMVLELKPVQGVEGATIREKLAEALVNAGRGADAAEAYLEAAGMARPDKVLHLRRRAAEQLLRSGLIDEGVEQLGTVLSAVGMTMPSTPRRALASLLVRRAQVRLRGIGFRERREAELAPDVLERVDLCWSVAAALGVVDNIRGADFQARGLLLALEAGEPDRVARALAVEACFAGTAGGDGKERVEMLLASAASCAVRVGRPSTVAWCALATGLASYCMGEWLRGYESSVRAEDLFHHKCTGVTWERATVEQTTIMSLFYLGRLAEQSRRVEMGVRGAAERGDLFARTYVTTGLAVVAWLTRNDPEGARRELGETMEKWSRRGYFFAHYWGLLASGQVDLYTGDARRAYEEANAHFPKLAQSQLIRVQIVKIEAHHLRARAALALAAQGGPDRAQLLREAERDASALEGEKMAWATPLARLVRAGVAAVRGETSEAAALAERAAIAFDAADMKLYAAAARHRRGALLGGSDGQALVAASEAFLVEQQVQAPARMLAMLAPGFPTGGG
jgi:tetratricopeptide (TPR) repeat protein